MQNLQIMSPINYNEKQLELPKQYLKNKKSNLSVKLQAVLNKSIIKKLMLMRYITC